MSKKVLIISSSLRNRSNSDKLADAFAEGVKKAGHLVEKINLKDMDWNFCKGCLACYKTKTGHCVQKDDVDEVIQKVREADVLCFASPLYYYNLCGQLKAFLDRVNPLLVLENKPWDLYLLMTAQENEEHTFDRAMTTLEGWSYCFPNSKIAGHLYAGDIYEVGDVDNSKCIGEARKMGAGV